MASLRRRFENWVLRGQTPARQPVRLDRRRIYILPTGQGYAFALLLFLLFLWSVNYSNSMGFAFTFLLAAVALNSMWQAHDNLLGVLVHPGQAEAVFAGQTAHVRFCLENREPRPRHGIALQWRDAAPGGAVYASLPANGAAAVTLELATVRRGWQRPGRLQISTRYPLGLLRAWSWVEFAQGVLVYPPPRGQRPLPPTAPGGAGRGIGEQDMGSEDYAGFRLYAPGDSPRRIAWKAASRGGPLLVKQFSEQARPELWLDWRNLEGEPVEMRLAQLCQWVLKAEATHRSYGLALPDLRLPPGQGGPHRRHCLEALALFRTTGEA